MNPGIVAKAQYILILTQKQLKKIADLNFTIIKKI